MRASLWQSYGCPCVIGCCVSCIFAVNYHRTRSCRINSCCLCEFPTRIFHRFSYFGARVAHAPFECPVIRRRYAMCNETAKMINKLESRLLEIPGNVQDAITSNHEPNEEGACPDWSGSNYVFTVAVGVQSQLCNCLKNQRSAHCFKTMHHIQ